MPLVTPGFWKRLALGFVGALVLLFIIESLLPDPPAPSPVVPDSTGTPESQPVVAAPPPSQAGPSRLDVRGRSARLNFGSQQMTLTAHLTALDAGRPQKVWLWAFFVNPPMDGGEGSWSDQPIEVPVDWKGLDTVTVIGSGHFHWATNPDVPRTGYMARIRASAVSAEDAQQRAALRDKSRQGMVRVQ